MRRRFAARHRAGEKYRRLHLRAGLALPRNENDKRLNGHDY